MHLVFDLFACQTASRLRGIGRYTQSLAEVMVRQAGDHAVTLMRDASPTYRDSAETLRQAFLPLVPRGRLVSYSYPPRSVLPHDAQGYEAVASALIHHAWRSVGPDAIISNPFEGWCESGIEPLPASYGSALQVALVYDFIPYLFADHYLTDPAYKAWYLARLAALGRFDLLLAISEATRQDAIRILGIEPERVVNISGAVSPLFQPTQVPPAARFEIRKPFVLYTGNADYRKNQTGMLQAYAALPPALRASHQLVLNQVGSLTEFWRTAAAAGLHRDEVVVTGHISDAELTSLYSHCALFVFPSLYEGFGLPILEAMSCGAPVLAADNSSIPELVGDPTMMFDASQCEAITTAMARALIDPAWRAHLCAYGKKRGAAFSWDRCARLAWQAIQTTAPRYVPAPQRMRIALVAELSDPTLDSTQHVLQFLPLLADYVDIDYFTERASISDTNRPGVQQCYPAETLLARRADYATVLWQFDDQPSHAFMLPLMLAWPGVVVVHTERCNVALAALDRQPAHDACLHAEVIAQYGLQGLLRSFEGSPPSHALPLYAWHELVDPGVHGAPPGAVLTRYRRALSNASANDTQHTTQLLAQALHGIPVNPSILNAISASASSNADLAALPRLLLDVTQLAKVDAMTGIQRVVKNIARGLCAPGVLDQPLELVQLVDGQLVRAAGAIANIFDLPAEYVPRQPIAIHPGDTLLMIDSSWEQYSQFADVFDIVRQRGGKIVTVVYDLIPLQSPHFFDPGLVGVFERWFAMAVAQSDQLMCISRTVASEVHDMLSRAPYVAQRQPDISWWPLGADIEIRPGQTDIREEVVRITSDQRTPMFLMVGTIEPRKNHAFVLDAFDALWQEGFNARLVIAGKAGWKVEQTIARIRSHPELGRRLFLIDRFTDAEIALCYRHATALIAASLAEGFGLPIVEAALHGTAVIASDIAVFREVGGKGVRYFLPTHGTDAMALVRTARVNKYKFATAGPSVELKTWHISASTLLENIIGADIPKHCQNFEMR